MSLFFIHVHNPLQLCLSPEAEWKIYYAIAYLKHGAILKVEAEGLSPPITIPNGRQTRAFD